MDFNIEQNHNRDKIEAFLSLVLSLRLGRWMRVTVLTALNVQSIARR
jgi:hypothetical protein